MNDSVAVVPFDEMTKMATSIVKSKLFGFETQEQALAIMMIAQAEGRHPALAARDYHIIQNRPALKADAMLARFQAGGGVVEWTAYSDDKVSGKFSHPTSCPRPIEIVWTLEQAKRIGLANKDNWRKYPRAMLRSRVISEGVRTVYPGIAVGVYTVEEVQDLVKEKDITPTSGAGTTLSEDARLRVAEVADKVREWMSSGSLTDAYGEIDNAELDADEQIFLWTHFDSRTRRQLKEEGERQRLQAKAKELPALITDAQKKRLEARIGEVKVNRDAVKAYCKDSFGKEHFSDLTREEYTELDKVLKSMAGAPVPESSGAAMVATQDAPAALITPDEALAIEARCTENAIKIPVVKKHFGIERFAQMTPQQLIEANELIDETLESRRKKADVPPLEP
jgi:hypothetical protein